mmetsp:Transcript_19040/g.38446  ORF Transcript_19040/g.38446 Transcript_19040/m.38446 type:complete len:276 (-) Transcript_19040:101-928(-)
MPKKKPARPSAAASTGSAILGGSASGFASKEYRSNQFDTVGTTCLPSSISRDDVRGYSDVLDRSMEVPFGPGSSKQGASVDWQVQSQDEIIKEVRQFVQAQKPWREEFDESVLERRREAERQERVDRGFMIILPDNRVRAIDTHLSARVHAQLLGEEEVPEPAPLPPPRPRRQDDSKKPRTARKFRNPWYLPPSSWFSNNAAHDPGAHQDGSFPYDTQIFRSESASYAGGGIGQSEDGEAGDGPHRLTQREKETLQIVEAYKQHMKGSRLPHFLL